MNCGEQKIWWRWNTHVEQRLKEYEKKTPTTHTQIEWIFYEYANAFYGRATFLRKSWMWKKKRKVLSNIIVSCFNIGLTAHVLHVIDYFSQRSWLIIHLCSRQKLFCSVKKGCCANEKKNKKICWYEQRERAMKYVQMVYRSAVQLQTI